MIIYGCGSWWYFQKRQVLKYPRGDKWWWIKISVWWIQNDIKIFFNFMGKHISLRMKTKRFSVRKSKLTAATVLSRNSLTNWNCTTHLLVKHRRMWNSSSFSFVWYLEIQQQIYVLGFVGVVGRWVLFQDSCF